MKPQHRIAVLIPCLNEELTIGKVVADFSAALPDAKIYVCDNNSSDQTVSVARESGAIVLREPLRGKGHVIRRMFADIDAAFYVLVDGDGTYDAACAPKMVEVMIAEQLDMVVGARIIGGNSFAYRRGHQFGNRVLTAIIAYVFGDRITDMLSGFRVFRRRFVKSFPALAGGFETETELTVHALTLNMPIKEMPTPYSERLSGSVSKLRTYSDGLIILRAIILLIKDERPLQFFAFAGVVLLALAFLVGFPVIITYFRIGLVPRYPSAILATGLVVLAFLAQVCGLVLDSVARGRKEIKRLAYLSIPLEM